jgi:ketosteroid isomerase-like protein
MANAKKRSSKKAARSKTTRRAAPKKKSAKQSAPRKAAASGLEALAQKIVRMSQLPHFGPAEIRELYNPDCVSVEGSGNTAMGYAGLEEKMKGWQQMTAGMVSKARNVWIGGNTICIEWDSTVTLRDGRTVKLLETAVHEIKNGKISSERFYYNPAALAPPQPRLPGV